MLTETDLEDQKEKLRKLLEFPKDITPDNPFTRSKFGDMTIIEIRLNCDEDVVITVDPIAS